MKQYKQHLQAILDRGTLKPAARENMPGTISLFGYQWKHDLKDGFPLLTTKKVYWKGVVVELLWFLRGDTNVKWLNDNGVTFWNEDAYAYYVKQMKTKPNGYMDFNSFEMILKSDKILPELTTYEGKKFTLGDCGYQYGKVWRDWNDFNSYNERPVIRVGKNMTKEEIEKFQEEWLEFHENQKAPLITVNDFKYEYPFKHIDQIKNLIEGLKNSPESRRHILTSIDPAHDNDLALYWCHALTQFNCRPIPWEIKLEMAKKHPNVDMENLAITEAASGNPDFGPIPQYYLDCQMYQRSADMFLGVPLNIASYALLTHILAKICNMVPGEMTYSYGDSHIYENHLEQVKEQLSREERELPKLLFKDEFHYICDSDLSQADPLTIINELKIDWFTLENYNPHPKIEGELSTGIKK